MKHEVTAENAPTIRAWFATRGGIVVWRSINLSNPGASWTGPLLTAEGQPSTKPTWQAADKPERTILDPAEVVVVTPKEVKRFRIGIRRGGNGLTLKLTDGATRRVNAAVAKAGEGAWYEFDFMTQEAIIFIPGDIGPL